IAGPATQVENAGIHTLQDVPKGASGAAPPHPVNVAGEHVIQKIVTGRDGGKHVAHGAGCGLLIARAGGSGSDDARLEGFRHRNSRVSASSFSRSSVASR